MLVQFILYALAFVIFQLVFNVISLPLAFWLLRVLMLSLCECTMDCIINIFCLMTDYTTLLFQYNKSSHQICYI